MLKYFLMLFNICGSLETIGTYFFIFYLAKFKATFIITMFRCWVWALIRINHFYILQLTRFKWWSASKCISIPLSNLVLYFQKISISYNLGQNCWGKIENYFMNKNTPLLPNQCVLDYLQQNLVKFKIYVRGKGEYLLF